MVKAKGRSGSWFATLDNTGEELPCVHRKWCIPKKPKGFYYLDPGAKPGEKIWDTFIEAIKQGKRVILTEEDEKKRRLKYLDAWKIDNITVSENELRFDFIERLFEVD